MKIKFDIEKTDKTTGKTYRPGIEYEIEDEKGKSILNSTMYAHKIEKVDNVENYVEKKGSVENGLRKEEKRRKKEIIDK